MVVAPPRESGDEYTQKESGLKARGVLDQMVELDRHRPLTDDELARLARFKDILMRIHLRLRAEGKLEKIFKGVDEKHNARKQST